MTRSLALCTTALGAILLSGCGDGGDPSAQIGADPRLPALQQYIIPQVNIAQPAKWAAGERPAVPEGFKIEPLADGLDHPRSVYVLPNGDVLIIESNGPAAPALRPAAEADNRRKRR